MRHLLRPAIVFLVSCGPPPGGATTATTQAPVELIKMTVGSRTIEMTRQLDVTTTEFQATRAQVWTALLSAHQTLGIPVVKEDANTGTAVYVHRNKALLAGKRVSTYVDCGATMMGARADTYAVTVTVNEALEASRAGTVAVHTSINAWAKNPGESTVSVPCSSTVALEKRIVELLAENLK